MRMLSRGLAIVVILLSGQAARAACGDNPGDAAAVSTAREAVDSSCDCTGSATHGSYVACARGVDQDRVDRGLLRPQCRVAVLRCARRSTCGRPGAVTCCRMTDQEARCAIRSGADRCTGCVGSLASCCDACGPSGCVTTSTTTTTLFPSTCGPSQYPTCGGTCPPGQRCVPFIVSDCGVGGGVNYDCVCSLESVGCGDVDPNSSFGCGAGPCPPDGVCLIDLSCGLCGCSYPTATTLTTTTTTTSATSTTIPSACGPSQYPSCGGDCPPGKRCVSFVICDGCDQGVPPVTNCLCVSQTQACGDNDPNGFFNCGAGPCPPNGVCAFDFFASLCGCVYP